MSIILKNDLKVAIFFIIICFSSTIWTMPSLKKISFEPSTYNTDSLIRQHPILTATAFTALLGLGYYWWQSKTTSMTNQPVKKLNGHGFAKWYLHNVVITASGWIKSLNWYNYFINKKSKKSSAQSIIPHIIHDKDLLYNIKHAQLNRLDVALTNSAPDSLNELSKWYKENKNEGKRPLSINSPQHLSVEELKPLFQENGLETGIFWEGSLRNPWNEAHWKEELNQLIENSNTPTTEDNINKKINNYNNKYNIGNRKRINLTKLPILMRDVKEILKSFLVEDMKQFNTLHVETNFQKKMRVIGRLITYIRLQSVIREHKLEHIFLPLKIVAVQYKKTKEYVSYPENSQILDKNIHFFIDGLSHGQVGLDFYSADYDRVLFAEKKHNYKIKFNKEAQGELKKLIQKVPFDVGFDNIFSDENGDVVIIDTEFEGESADQSIANLSRYEIN